MYKDQLHTYFDEGIDITYLRKSRKDGDLTIEEVLERHEKQLKEFAKNDLNTELKEEFIFREVVSGEQIDARPELLKIFGLIQQGNVRRLFILEPARLSRGDLEDAGRIINMLRYNSVKVVTPYRTFDLEDKYDREFFTMELNQSNRHLEYTKEILNRGRLQSIKEGKAIMSSPPYGYDKEKLKREKGFKLIPHETEAPILKTIFEMCCDGVGTSTIANQLNLMNIPVRKGDRWTPETLRGILKNPTYVGMLYWQKSIETKVYTLDGMSKKRKYNNEDMILVKGLHEPLITDDQFLLAQEMLRRNAQNKVPKNKEIKNVLSGLAFCSHCGKAMIRRPYTKVYKKRETRVHEIDKQELLTFLRDHKQKSGLSLTQIAKDLNVDRSTVTYWFTPDINRFYPSFKFAQKWFELKVLLDIQTDKYDEKITLYQKPPVPRDSMICSTPHCKTVGVYLEEVEKRVLSDLTTILKDYTYFLENYEEEIKKDVLDNTRRLELINNKIDDLKKELKATRRDKNKGLYTDEEYLETKAEIDEEIAELLDQKESITTSTEADKLTRYKKAIPKINECLDTYHTLSIQDKNEVLKSLIEKIIYTKFEGGRWNPNADFQLEIFLNI